MRSGHVLLIGALLWLPSAWLRPPERQQELRVLVTARNMVTSGDWLHPEFQNQPRYRKPPLAYWTAALGFLLTDRHHDAWAGRLFFLLVALGGLEIFRRLAGSRAALGMLFTYGVWMYAPLAETDFLQLSGILVAVWGWRRHSGVLAGLGMAAASLAKGPGGLLVPALTFLFLCRSHPRPFRFWIVGLGLPLLAAGAWLTFLQLDPAASQALANEWSDTFWDSPHAGPWPYYLWTLPLMMLPAGAWVFFLRAPPPAEGAADRRVAATWFWVAFVLLTLTVSKQRHYALLLIPPACWWLALRLPPSPLPKLRLPLALALLLLLAQSAHALWSPEARHSRFLSRARRRVADAQTLHVVGINSARFDFHLGRHVENTHSLSHALARAAPGDAVLVIQSRPDPSDAFPLPTEAESNAPRDAPPRLTLDDPGWIRELYRAP